MNITRSAMSIVGESRTASVARRAEGQLNNMNDQQSGIELAAELTMAWLGNPNTRAGSDDVLNFLRSTFQAVEGLGV